jgi:hypothetical protein
VTAAIWWTKARMGWKETTVQHFQDADGNPIGPTINFYGRPEMHPKQWTALDTNATESVIAATSGISSALAAKAATNGRGSPAVCTENQILQYW